MAQLTADHYPMCADAAKACYAKWQSLAALLFQNLWRGDFRSLLPSPLPSVRTRWNVMTWFSFEQPFSPCERAVGRQTQSGCRSVCPPAAARPLAPALLSGSRARAGRLSQLPPAVVSSGKRDNLKMLVSGESHGRYWRGSSGKQ